MISANATLQVWVDNENYSLALNKVTKTSVGDLDIVMGCGSDPQKMHKTLQQKKHLLPVNILIAITFQLTI
jgi:hypothetical protein